MRINSYMPFVVISAAQADVSPITNVVNHELLKSRCRNFVEGVGVTEKWGTERVLLVFDKIDMLPALLAAIEFDQEAIVSVDQFRNAQLLSAKNTAVENLGVWTEISQPEAEVQDHTMVFGKHFKDGKDRYYACK